ncbi:MAG TPA: hypothetical protein VLG16_04030, partial [Candidatus Saccharimonadales bacterium]|nr:hypothetical protein [Candidatus Saccharimonadales bacterium]
RFHKLAALTEKSIRGEIDSCKAEPDYVQIVAPWFAVKCYYRTYYLESILIHLASGANNVFKNNGHSYVRKIIRTYCKNGYYVSKMKHAEDVVATQDALVHKITAGRNLKQDYYLSDDCVKSVRHKLAEYSVDHWKKNSPHKNFRSATAKADLKKYLAGSEICLFDFFYQMRVKANYRDTDFLDFDKISSADGVKYVQMLKSATDKYCNALQKGIDDMLADRSLSI